MWSTYGSGGKAGGIAIVALLSFGGLFGVGKATSGDEKPMPAVVVPTPPPVKPLTEVRAVPALQTPTPTPKPKRRRPPRPVATAAAPPPVPTGTPVAVTTAAPVVTSVPTAVPQAPAPLPQVTSAPAPPPRPEPAEPESAGSFDDSG